MDIIVVGRMSCGLGRAKDNPLTVAGDSKPVLERGSRYPVSASGRDLQTARKPSTILRNCTNKDFSSVQLFYYTPRKKHKNKRKPQLEFPRCQPHQSSARLR